MYIFNKVNAGFQCNMMDLDYNSSCNLLIVISKSYFIIFFLDYFINTHISRHIIIIICTVFL